MIETLADRRTLVREAGEDFATGAEDPLRAIWDPESNEANAGELAVRVNRVTILAVDEDLDEQAIIKGSPIRRLATDVRYTVRDLEADGHGMTHLILRKI